MSKGFCILLAGLALIAVCSAGSIPRLDVVTQAMYWQGWFCPNASRPEASCEVKCYKLLATRMTFDKAREECAALKEDTDLFTPTVLQINAEWEEFDAGIGGIILESEAQKLRTTVWVGPSEFVANRTTSGIGHCYQYHVETNPHFTIFRYVKAPCPKKNLVLCQTYPYKVTDLLGRLGKLEDPSILDFL